MFWLLFDDVEHLVYITATVIAEWIMESEACSEAGDVCSARRAGFLGNRNVAECSETNCIRF